MTITDADLERLLNLAAAEYAVPEDGIDTVLAAERAPAPPKVRTRRTWFAPKRLAIGIVALAVLGVFIGGAVTSGPSKKTAGTTLSAAPTGGGDLDVASGHRSAAAASAPPIGNLAPQALSNGKFAPNGLPVAASAAAATGATGGTTSTGTTGGGTVPTAGTVNAPVPAAPVTAPTAAAAGGLGSFSSGSTGSGGGAAAKAADAGTSDAAKIVRTGQADLTVVKGAVPAAQDKLEGLATALGGYVANEKSSGGDYPTASVTIRVPGEMFAQLVKQVQTIGKVADLSTQAADVTSSYTDLTARIHALETQRDTYLTLLAKASSIQETLAVQQRVDNVQTQLEQLQGQQKVLDDQTSYGSLAVTVSQEGQPVTLPTEPKPLTGFGKAWHDAKHRFNGGVQGLVAASGPVAFIAILVLAVWLVWLAVRRRWQRARV